MKTYSAHIPKKGFLFLKKLKKNNNREWFLQNKNEFEQTLKFPLQQIILELQDLMKSKAPQINFDPKTSVFRLNRDVRFSENKAPYKTNLGAAFNLKAYHKKDQYPGLYLHIEPGDCFIGGGLYMPMGDQIRKIREHIQKDPKKFQKIINSPAVQKNFGGLVGEKLKTAPKGIDKNHPAIELLKWKQFIYIKHFNDNDFQKNSVAQLIFKDYQQMLPLLHWLEEALQSW